MIVAFGQNNIISVQHHHLHKHHCGSPSVENPHNVLAIAPKCFQMHKAFLISRNNSMTPAAQMSQTNRHDCVAAAGARLRQFSSTASYRGLLRREGEQRGDRKNCNHLNISLLKIPEGKLTICLFIHFIDFNLAVPLVLVFIVSPVTFLDDEVL